MAGDNTIEVRITAENQQFISKMKEMIAMMEEADTQAKNSGANMKSSFSGGDNFFDGFIGGLAKANLAGQAVISVLREIKDMAASIVMPGFEFEKNIESAQLGIAGILQSMGQINGKSIDFGTAMDIASKQVQKLNTDAMRTAATTKDLVTTFQGLVAPGLGAGMNLDQIQQLTTVGVNFAMAQGLDSRQYLQELRDLVQGGIQPASSQLATALGLTDADITKAKNSTEGLFSFLMERMSGAQEAAEKFPDTFAGIESQISEFAQQASAGITQEYGGEIKYFLNEIRDLFGSVNEESGKFEVNPAILEFIDDLGEGYFWLLEVYDGTVDWFSALADTDAMTELIGLCGDLWDILKEVGIISVANINNIGQFFRAVGNNAVVVGLIRLLRALANELKYVLTLMGMDFNKNAVEYEKQNDDLLGHSVGKSNAADEARARMAEYKAEYEAIRQKRENSPDMSSNVKNKFTTSNDNAQKKALQEQLKANKEALQQQTELIKANLDAQLEAIKDTMESIQLAFDQARIGWAAYGVEKTQNDVQQEQARIDAIKQQIAAVQDSDAYKTQDAMNAAIGKLRIELEKHERALEKLTDVQKDVANVIAAYGGKSVTPNLDAQKAGQGQTVPEGATNSEAALYSAYQAVKDTDKTGQLTYDLLLGMAQQESGLAHWDEKGNVKTSFDGGIGLMQLTSDYAKGLAGDPYDLYKNALGGAKYLVELLNQYGNLHTALARYNGSGPAAEQYADSVLGHAQEQNARATYLLSQPQVGSGYGATSAVSGGVVQGIDAGFQAWENQTMENMRVGCVEAVRKIGSWYSDFLAKEATNNVPQLQKDAENAGVPEIPYDESKLKPGDVIVYDGNEHVLVYRGNGRTVGNSSGALDNIYGKGQGPGKVIEQGIDIGMPPTSIIQTGTYGVASNLAGMVDYDPKTNTGEAIKKKALENNKLAQEAMKQYLELSGDISTIPIEQLIQQIHDMQKKLRANGHNKEADSLNVVLAAKQNELEFKTQANYLKTAMNIIQSNASDMVYKIGNGMYDAADMAKKYLGYINGGNYPGGKFSIKTIMDKLRQELKKAEELSDVSSMAEITKTIQGIQDDLVKMVKNFQQAVEDRAVWRSNMIDANYGLSSGQKERAKKEVEREKQAESAKINRGLAEEYYQSSRTAPNAKQRVTDLAIADYYSRQAALNEELAKTPSLLKEIRKTAKDSLEDGLVTFLTDGVNQAESLAEAFRNMATSILKELQKVFAKHITADIMDKWFPGQSNTGNATAEDYHTTQEYSAQIGQYGQKLMMDMGNFQSSVVTAADGFDSALQGVTSRIVSSLLSATSSVSAATASAGSSYSFSMPSITGADLQHRADGGAIAGPGTETSDSIPIMASNNEYMVRATAHKKYGTAMLDAINNGSLYEYLQRTLGRIQDGTFANFRVRVPKFAKGGAIGAAGADAAGRFTADLGASFSTPVHINNYVDGRRVVDTDLIRTIVQKENARSAKLNSVLQRRF